MVKFEGATTALITPMYESGEIHFDDLERLAEFQIRYGIHNLLSCGTTGQSPALDWKEHERISEIVQRKINGRVPLIVGAGSNNTREAIEATSAAKAIGADATLHVTGYYNMPSVDGLFDYFSNCANIELPLIMYDVRSRGHPPLVPEMRIKLAKEHSNIIGVKDASGDLDTWLETRRLAKKHGLDKHSFKILSGDDQSTYEIMSNPKTEGVGIISVTGNIFPREIARMAELLLEGRCDEAWDINTRLEPVNTNLKLTVYDFTMRIDEKEYTVINYYRNPTFIQTAIHMLGMIESDYMRSPLVQLPGEYKEYVRDILRTVYQTNPGFFQPIKEFYGSDIESRLKS